MIPTPVADFTRLQALLNLASFRPPALPLDARVSSLDPYPSDHIVQQITSQKASALQQLEQIQNLTEEIHAATVALTQPIFAELRRRQEDLKRRVHAAKTLTTPVRKVPPEIWADIFVSVADLATADFRLRREGEVSWNENIILLVCRYWGTIARATPKMWSHIFAFALPCEFQQFAVTRLVRAQGAATISLDCTDRRGRSKETPPTEETEWIFSLLNTEMSRISVLRLRLNAVQCIPSHTRMHFPVMCELVLFVSCHKDDHCRCTYCSDFISQTTLEIDAPNLGHLTIYDPELVRIVTGCTELSTLTLHAFNLSADAFNVFLQHVPVLSPKTLEIGFWCLTFYSRAEVQGLAAIPSVQRLNIYSSTPHCGYIFVDAAAQSLRVLRTTILHESALGGIEACHTLQCLSLCFDTGSIEVFDGKSLRALVRRLMCVSQIDLEVRDGAISRQWIGDERPLLLEILRLRIGADEPSYEETRNRPFSLSSRARKRERALRKKAKFHSKDEADTSGKTDDLDDIRTPLDCVSYHLTRRPGPLQKRASEGLAEIDRLLRGAGYSRLCEEYERRIFWVHPQFDGTPIMWGDQDSEAARQNIVKYKWY